VRGLRGDLWHMPTAILFPGQGSQTPDMRERVAELRPDLLDLATEVVGEDPFARADDDTRFAQPAMLAAAQAISERDALRLAALRGRLMSESGARRGDGTMLAALGGDDATVVGIAQQHGVTVANDNAPGQLVLSGERAALQAAGTSLREAGVRVLELNVAGAFHSPFMADAVPDFAEALGATYVRAPRIEVWSCVTAKPMDDVRRRLAEGLTAPVRWRETVINLHEAGFDRFVDVGPGKVLAKLVKRIAKSAELVHA